MKNIPIICVAASKLSKIEDDKAIDINQSEYRWQHDYIPSRNIVVVMGSGERINLAIVPEVPKKPQSGSPGARVEVGDDGKGAIQGKSKAISSSYFCERPDHIIGEWKERSQQLFLNRNHPFVKKYFLKSNVNPQSKLGKRSNILYWELNNLSRAIFHTSQVAKIEQKNDKLADNGYNVDDAYDFVGDDVLRQHIENSPLVAKLLKSIDNYSEEDESDSDSDD